MIPRILATGLVMVALLAGYTATAPAQELAIGGGNHLRVVDTATSQVVVDVTRYSDVSRLAYRPDGSVLAVGECFRNRVVTLDPGASYAETGVSLSGHA
jgi:hypothetical protein